MNKTYLNTLRTLLDKLENTQENAIDAVSAVCADPDYKNRLMLVATAKLPTLRLKLHSSADSLKQSKVFVSRLQELVESN